jgi:hypothetical protein
MRQQDIREAQNRSEMKDKYKRETTHQKLTQKPMRVD